MSLVALIPPCAQTECDRLTGTIENRSTVTPSSASLIAQASPANPPPTTITFFFDAIAILIYQIPTTFPSPSWPASRGRTSDGDRDASRNIQVVCPVSSARARCASPHDTTPSQEVLAAPSPTACASYQKSSPHPRPTVHRRRDSARICSRHIQSASAYPPQW